jgi:hypothetical protein
MSNVAEGMKPDPSISPSSNVEQQLADIKRAIDHAAIVATTDVAGRITDVND